jgi:hypothetical protein
MGAGGGARLWMWVWVRAGVDAGIKMRIYRISPIKETKRVAFG